MHSWDLISPRDVIWRSYFVIDWCLTWCHYRPRENLTVFQEKLQLEQSSKNDYQLLLILSLTHWQTTITTWLIYIEDSTWKMLGCQHRKCHMCWLGIYSWAHNIQNSFPDMYTSMLSYQFVSWDHSPFWKILHSLDLITLLFMPLSFPLSPLTQNLHIKLF